MILAEILENNKIYLSEHKNTDAIADGVKFETVCFSFPKSWEGFQKTAVFSTDDKTINVVLSKGNNMCISETECYIPYEVLKDSEFDLSVFGVKGDSIATSSKETVRVLESGYALGESPKNPTQSEYQQIINITETAKTIADSVRKDADNGLFKGDKGEKGDKGDKGDQGIKGDKGDKGEPGNIENIDIAFNPESENAQSGKAVASAVANALKSETNTEWVFDGGDASSEIGIEFSIDNEMSDQSANPVANKTVKNYVDTNIKNVNDKILPLADYIVESGVIDSWTYRKWNSGIAECWKNVSIKTNINLSPTETGTKIYYGEKTFERLDYPFSFIGVPISNFTLNYASSNFIYHSVVQFVDSEWNTKTREYRLISHYPVNTENRYTGSYYVIGKWK